jgi:hypothetical protein
LRFSGPILEYRHYVVRRLQLPVPNLLMFHKLHFQDIGMVNPKLSLPVLVQKRLVSNIRGKTFASSEESVGY